MNYTQKGVRTLTVEDWLRLAKSGAEIPVQIPLDGHSMMPLIRRNRDIVTIVPLARRPVRGDVVLFINRQGKYAVHRVFRVSDREAVTLGDNCYQTDGAVPLESILGLAVSVRRGKLDISLDSGFPRFCGRVWMSAMPLRRMLRRAYHLIIHKT